MSYQQNKRQPPFFACAQDLALELEKERTGRIIAQQTANQEKLQARASAAESASLRRQLNELAQQMEQEKKKAAAAKQQGQQAAETGMQQSRSAAEVMGSLLNCVCSIIDMINGSLPI